MALTRPRYSQIYDTDYKQSVRVATTANVGNLLATGNMTNTVDGVSLVLLDRILVKDQTDSKQNGIYRVLTVGSGSNGTWGRTLDADANDKMTAGMTTIVSEGSDNANKTFRLATPDPIVVGTTELSFVNPFAGGSAAGANTHVQFNDGGTVGASSGFAFNKVGNVLSVGGNINVTGSILPTANVEYDLGSPTLRWRDGYFSGNTIDLGGATISVHPTNGFTFTAPGHAAVALAGGGGNSLSATIILANLNMKGYVDGQISTTTAAISTANTIQSSQITAVSSSVTGANAAIVTANTNMKGYVDTINTTLTSNAAVQSGSIATLTSNAAVQSGDIATLFANAGAQAGQIVTANTNMKGYVDGEISTTTTAITTANTNLKGYVDAANTIQSNQISGANSAITTANTNMKGYVDGQISTTTTAITTANTNMKGYVDGQITNLVGGSPATLDTLNEIAQALGNDANLSTTLTNLISGVQGNVTAANSAITTANTNMKGYVDGQISTTTTAINTANTIQSSQITAVSSSVTGANAAIVTANTNMKGYVDSVANLSSYSDANVTAYLPTHSGNVGAASVNATNLFGTLLTAAQTNITSVGTLTSLGIASNLNFTSTGNRITGDFSNATVPSRVMFQSTTANSVTAVSAIPNGTGIQSTFNVFSQSDPANSSFGGFTVVNNSDVRLVSGLTGTGTFLPMTFITGGSEAIRINTDRQLVIGSNGNILSTGSGAFSLDTRLTVYGDINLARFGTAPAVGQRYARGTDGSPTSVVDGDRLGALFNGGYHLGLNSGAGAWQNPTLIATFVDGDSTSVSTTIPGRLSFFTAPLNGSRTERMRINGFGNVGIGNTNPLHTLSVGGSSDITGNVSLSGVGRRFFAEMSAATQSDRFAFQTNTLNNNTNILGIPNGTSVQTTWQAFGNSDPNNAHRIFFGTTTSTDTRIVSDAIGTGVVQPMIFIVGAKESLRIGTVGNITVPGNITINSDNNTVAIFNGGTNGVGNIGSSGAGFNTVFARATSAQYADLAEIYLGDRDYIPATVVVFGGDREVTVSLISHDPSVAGVVSTNPAYLMNDRFDGTAVALQGRVPCRVLGPVNKGDCVVTSDVRGVAERLNMTKYQPGCIIGKSLDYVPEGEIATIEVVVGRN